jgi:hypothetical protein
MPPDLSHVPSCRPARVSPPFFSCSILYRLIAVSICSSVGLKTKPSQSGLHRPAIPSGRRTRWISLTPRTNRAVAHNYPWAVDHSFRTESDDQRIFTVIARRGPIRSHTSHWSPSGERRCFSLPGSRNQYWRPYDFHRNRGSRFGASSKAWFLKLSRGRVPFFKVTNRIVFWE